MKGTQEDREEFRSRVKAALGDRTQKDLERSLGLAGSTLTRVFGGRRNIDAEFVEALATELGTTPRALVAGTGFAELLGEPSALSPQSEVAVLDDEEGLQTSEPAPEPGPEPSAQAAQTLPSREEPLASDIEPDLEWDPQITSSPQPADFGELEDEDTVVEEYAPARESYESAATVLAAPTESPGPDFDVQMEATGPDRGPGGHGPSLGGANSAGASEEERRRSGIGGRVVRFFSRIFGG